MSILPSSMHLPAYLTVSLPVHPFVSLPACGFSLSPCLSACLSVCPLVCLSFCLRKSGLACPPVLDHTKTKSTLYLCLSTWLVSLSSLLVWSFFLSLLLLLSVMFWFACYWKLLTRAVWGCVRPGAISLTDRVTDPFQVIASITRVVHNGAKVGATPSYNMHEEMGPWTQSRALWCWRKKKRKEKNILNFVSFWVLK